MEVNIGVSDEDDESILDDAPAIVQVIGLLIIFLWEVTVILFKVAFLITKTVIGITILVASALVIAMALLA